MGDKKSGDGRDWYILVPMAVAAVALGYWGFSVCADCGVSGPVNILLKSFALIKGGTTYTHPWQLVVAQWLIPLVALLGFAKLVITRVRRDVSLVLAKRARNHVIVCGLGDTGNAVALAQRAAGRKVVVIDRDNDSAAAHSLDLAGIPVLKGNATDAHVLKLAGLNRSASIVVCCGSDAVNLEVALNARDASSQRSKEAPLRIFCEVREDWLLRTVAGATASLSSDVAEFVAVNFYENGARLLLNGLAAKRKLLPVRSPRLLIVGFGNMGLEVLVQAVRSTFAVPGMRLSATIVDRNAKLARETILHSLPGLHDLADLSFVEREFGTGDDSAFVDQILRGEPPDMVFATTQSDETNMRTALFIRRRLDIAGLYAVPVYSRDQGQPELGALIARIEQPKAAFDRLLPFAGGGLLAGADALERDPLDNLARAAHAVYARRNEDAHPAPWEKLSERMKRSNRYFADHIAVKLARLGFDLTIKGPPASFTDAEIEELSQMEHWRWTIEQKLDGWQYGPVRDDLAKRHPLMMDWSTLPEHAKETNRALVRGIPEILASVGKIMRRNRVVTASALNSTATTSDARLVVLADTSDDLSRFGNASGQTAVWLRTTKDLTPTQIEAKQNAAGPAFEAWVDRDAAVPA